MQPYHGEHDVKKSTLYSVFIGIQVECVETCGHDGAGSSNKDLKTLK
jgi:hypothetical protein